MKKRIDAAELPQLQIQEFSFTRPRRSWLPNAGVAAPSVRSPLRRLPLAHVRVEATADGGSWIHRARLN